MLPNLPVKNAQKQHFFPENKWYLVKIVSIILISSESSLQQQIFHEKNRYVQFSLAIIQNMFLPNFTHVTLSLFSKHVSYKNATFFSYSVIQLSYAQKRD